MKVEGSRLVVSRPWTLPLWRDFRLSRLLRLLLWLRLPSINGCVEEGGTISDGLMRGRLATMATLATMTALNTSRALVASLPVEGLHRKTVLIMLERRRLNKGRLAS